MDTPADIAAALTALCTELLPDVVQTPKYGGVLFHFPGDKAEDGVCGVFAYAAHVSLEFAHGAQMPDPDGLLLGKGKHRRHLKFTSCNDITAQPTARYIQAAADLILNRGA